MARKKETETETETGAEETLDEQRAALSEQFDELEKQRAEVQARSDEFEQVAAALENQAEKLKAEREALESDRLALEQRAAGDKDAPAASTSEPPEGAVVVLMDAQYIDPSVLFSSTTHHRKPDTVPKTPDGQRAAVYFEPGRFHPSALGNVPKEAYEILDAAEGVPKARDLQIFI